MKNKFQYYSIITVLALVLGACTKLADRNINPDAASIPLNSALLTSVESNLAVGLASDATLASTQYFAQYFSQVQYPDNQLYAQSNVSWNIFYAGRLYDLQNIISTATAKPDPAAFAGNTVNQIQIARILKVYWYSLATDRYGDIPYTQALKGTTTAAYDKQKDIYTDFFKELKEAVAGFQTTGNPILGDIVYNGNLANWKKFANSLRMMLAMRLSKVDPATGKTEFTAALNDANGYITANTENFKVTYPGGTFINPYNGLTGASILAISATVADKLNTYGDPRVAAFGQVNASGKVKGVPYGLNRAHNQTFLVANPDYSTIFATTWKTASSPVHLITASYIDLLRAEAAITYGTGENAFTLLKKGVSDSWAQWAVTGNVDAYLTTVGVTAVSVPVAKIQEQTWIALYGAGQQGWSEWRRTGIPVLTPAPDAVNPGGQIPRRFGYPTTEPNFNGTNYSAAVAAFPYGGGDVVTSRMWWDK
jgi:hypothetical protein